MEAAQAQPNQDRGVAPSPNGLCPWWEFPSRRGCVARQGKALHFQIMRKRDAQITVRLASPLLAHLEEEALASGRSVSNLIRQILIDHTAQRVAATATTQREAA